MTPPDHSEHTPAEQPVFGAKRAAEIAGVSVSTIRRNRSRLEACGAEISPDGWKVPVSALVASGLMKPTTPVPDYPEPEKGSQNATQSHPEVRELERQVMELRHRAELAEERQHSAEQRAEAAQKLADTLADTLNVERRMLTMGADTSESPSAPLISKDLPASHTEHTQKQSSWWRRFF